MTVPYLLFNFANKRITIMFNVYCLSTKGAFNITPLNKTKNN